MSRICVRSHPTKSLPDQMKLKRSHLWLISGAIAFCYPTSSRYFRTTAGKSAKTHRQSCSIE
ncbi:hypothetical protein [Nostoc sp. 'Peltigera membranacea cyanobiont' 232]|uniref:hypothetical protein n=1 Tax=Nostoc sp. 'Peltigera membranacea cyanobiont' 232 TaxID=2014531 RepID=UPI00117D7845|nr:hypothetical protein [Nostoc sp. 'Peltigera membranacea cyanobiont' 232]